ncbi:hypothetical protein C8P63_11347 [Melghirimyces profundicolus]|uniref:Uncharacterized protein n=1 Tax=Melghirimyces profundicolus TaxID=1242148 RepID=A0A2T6BSQ7_9BACL|nr:hypothetical protein [Melghirimyces profundicolus]PTX59102.1 hypothetical protein C8P63_11347 [Melghirimyces profundicolus]
MNSISEKTWYQIRDFVSVFGTVHLVHALMDYFRHDQLNSYVVFTGTMGAVSFLIAIIAHRRVSKEFERRYEQKRKERMKGKAGRWIGFYIILILLTVAIVNILAHKGGWE